MSLMLIVNLPKINLFVGAMVNQENEFTNPFNTVQSWESDGNVIVKLWPHMQDLDIPIAGEVEEKEELKNWLKEGKWKIGKFSHTEIRNSSF